MLTNYDNKMLNNNYETKEAKVERYFAEMTFNVKIPGHEAGTTERIQVDKKGTPLDKELRRRLKDAEIDNCVSLKLEQIEKSKKTVQKKIETKKEK